MSRYRQGNIPKNGFTLVELLLVAGLLVMVAALSTPNIIRKCQAVYLQQTANEMVFIMREAQSRAVIKGITHQFRYEPNTHRYRVTQMVSDPGFTTSESEFKPVAGRLGEEFNVPPGINVDLNRMIRFERNGRIDKVRFSVCQDKACWWISTQEQYGTVAISPDIQ